MTTSTRFVLAALLEHTDSDAADLIRNTPRIDPVAPVHADFVGAGGPAALAEATEAWKAFQKANRNLHGFLVLCVAQGKDRDIQGIVDSCETDELNSRAIGGGRGGK